MSEDFTRRLEPRLEEIAEHFGTPFHIYDEVGILASADRLAAAFGGLPFHEYYAVKALPNLTITRMLRERGLGMECSSIAELELAADSDARGEEIFFTSNNTTREEFAVALSLEAIINIDDVTLIDKLPGVPAVCSFRFNPGPERRRRQADRLARGGQVRAAPRPARGRLTSGCASSEPSASACTR